MSLLPGRSFELKDVSFVWFNGDDDANVKPHWKTLPLGTNTVSLKVYPIVGKIDHYEVYEVDGHKIVSFLGSGLESEVQAVLEDRIDHHLGRSVA